MGFGDQAVAEVVVEEAKEANEKKANNTNKKCPSPKNDAFGLTFLFFYPPLFPTETPARVAVHTLRCLVVMVAFNLYCAPER